MVKVMFVCLGNICRSPLAHAVMEKKVADAGLSDQIEVDSSGTGNWHVGGPSDSRMITEAKKHNLPMTHRAQQFDPKHEAEFDYIFAMDHSNLSNIRLILQKESPKVKLFRSFDSELDGDEVPDPYFGGEAGFSLVYEMVDRNCDIILSRIKEEYYL